MDARRAAVTALMRVHQQQGYSNVVLDNLLESGDQSPVDRALTSRLFYGVIERCLTLDFLLNRCSSTPVKKMDPVVLDILRTGVYQLVYMDKTPSFAVLNEAVRLTRDMGQARLSGFVNAVLHTVQRTYRELLDGLPDTDKGLEIRFSCPRVWIRGWREAYGEGTMRQLLEHLNDTPAAYIRVNTLLTDPNRLRQRLEQADIVCTSVEGLPEALCVSPAWALCRLPVDIQRQFYYQDIASQWCCAALGAQPGDRVADVCAAPGGKSFTVAQAMQNTGSLLSGDLYEQKCATIACRAGEFGITCLHTVQRDASTPVPEEWKEAFDRVICDVPCSGLGVIRRKPEIRYKNPAEFDDLPALQLQILEQSAAMVRPGGILQYSTCTLRPEENEQVTKAFLSLHPDYSPRPLERLKLCFEKAGLPVLDKITLFPSVHDSDGFFIAGFVKTGK